MTILSSINSLRVWGIKGAIDFARRWPTRHRLKHSDKHTTATPQRGITLIGPFSSHSGNSHTMRNFAEMLSTTGIPFQTFDMNNCPTLPTKDYAHILTRPRDFDLGRYSHVVELFSPHAPQSPNRVHSLLAFWEYESGFEFAFPSTVQSRLPIIAMSDFNARHFRSIVPNGVPILKIRHPLILKTDNAPPPEKVRARYRIPKTAFVVFFNFDYGSSYYRKNPEAVLKAFATAFTQNDDAILLLKTSNAKRNPATVARLLSLAHNLALGPKRLIIIDDAIPQCDMSGLFQACDVYISLHRGEGFGIGMAEAMSCGKTVIASDFSANTEFCTAMTSIPVPCSITSPSKCEIDNPAYKQVTAWADPDISFAASALAKCYTQRDFANQIGAAGAKFVQEYFSPDNFKKDVNAFLDFHPNPSATP